MLDLVIADALVLDGTGAPAFRGSVGVAGDRIAWVGEVGSAEPPAGRKIAAGGRTIAPGFIDVHNHSDLAPFVNPAMASTLRQGVTSVVVGNCGSSPWPEAGAAECALLVGGDPGSFAEGWPGFGAYLDALDAARPGANVAALVGHGAVRMQVMGRERRAPTDREIREMRALVREAIGDGAVGLSTGLIYVPGIYSDTDEVVALAEVVVDGIYASHIRGEGEHLFRAISEAIEVGAKAETPVHVSHLKCETRLAWGRAGELLERLRTGGDVTADQYPYTAWNSSLASLLPDWAPVAELERILEGDHGRLRRAVEEGEETFQSSVKGVGWDRIVIESSGDGRWNAKSVTEVADGLSVDTFEACVALLLEDPDTSCIGHPMAEADVLEILADPEVFVASDGAAMSPEGPFGRTPVHPRNYGTFPRALELVRDEGLLSFEQAVRKMTSLPAARFGLAGRGTVAEGGYADLVVFDQEKVSDEASFDRPHVFPSGIDLVLVNGEIAWDGAVLGSRAGRALRRG